MIKQFFKQFRFVRKDQLVVDASEYVSLKLKKEQSTLSMAELTQHQLGSFIPSFKFLADQTDDYKVSMSTFCKQIFDSPYWQFLIESLKQEQVNNLLFVNPRPSEEWVRGSINGIYIVEEEIRLLASADKDNKKTKEGKTS
mgnify:CR=1 FL=1